VGESRIAASIPHPNIVSVYDAGEAEGLLYIAMQYIDGTDLASVLRHGRRLEPAQVLSIVGQAGSALDAAHERGLVHRDVKPGNILLDSQRAYLTDFGLTKPAAAGTALSVPGQLVGTINYVAPEQIRGDPLDGRADVYELGCVLYECLVGQIPYPRESEIAALYAHIQDPPPRPSENAELPAAFDHTIAKALAKSPDDRFSTCAALLTSAREALGAESASDEAAVMPSWPVARTTPTRSLTSGRTRLPGARRWSGRRLVRAGILASLLAVAVGTALTLALTRGGGASPGRSQGAAPPRTPAEPPRMVVTSVAVGARPAGIALGTGGVWVANSGDGTVARLDPVTGTNTGTLARVGTRPVAIAERSHTVFVANTGGHSISRIDALSGSPTGGTIALGRTPRAIAVGVGEPTIWVAASDGTVTRIDTASGAIVGHPIRIGGRTRGIATARGEAWVTSANGTVSRIDARRVVGRPVRVGRRPRGIAVGYGVVWVANEASNTVTRLSTHSGRVIGDPIRVGRAPAAIAVGLGYVWVANSGDGTVTRLTPPDGRVAGRPLRVGRRPLGIRVGAGSVWVTNERSGTVSRIVPLNARPTSG
jgi:DNA-binding beta-propeller fold protein YncE